MWNCRECSEQIEDPFTACWKCGTEREARTAPKAADRGVPEAPAAGMNAIPTDAEAQVPKTQAGDPFELKIVVGCLFLGFILEVINADGAKSRLLIGGVYFILLLGVKERAVWAWWLSVIFFSLRGPSLLLLFAYWNDWIPPGIWEIWVWMAGITRSVDLEVAGLIKSVEVMGAVVGLINCTIAALLIRCRWRGAYRRAP